MLEPTYTQWIRACPIAKTCGTYEYGINEIRVPLFEG